MAVLHNNVFDAALSYIAANAIEAEVQSAGSVALVDGIVLDANNFGAPEDNSGDGGGRLISCLVDDENDMKAIPVDSAGDATKVVLKNGAGTVLVETAILNAPRTLGATDQVNLASFNVIMKDPS